MFKKLFSRNLLAMNKEEDEDYLRHVKNNIFDHFCRELVKHGEAFVEKVKGQVYSTDIFADINKKFELQAIKNGSYEHQFIAHYEELEDFKKKITMGLDVLRDRINILYDEIQELEKTVEENHGYAVCKIGLNDGMDKKSVEERKAQAKKIQLGLSINKVAKKSGKRTVWTDELEKKAISLRAYGFGYASIAKKLGVSAGSIRNHLIPLGK